jgi:cysteine-rich repeat protein
MSAAVPAAPACSGCPYGGKCLPAGYRFVADGTPSYCDVTGIHAQKDVDESCSDNFMCKTNACPSGRCMDTQGMNSMFISLYCRIFNLLNEPGYQACLIEHGIGTAVCGDGICSASAGETAATCPADCVTSFCSGVVCNDENECTADSCDPDTGECVFEIVDCSDGDPCTDDFCNTASGCAHAPIAGCGGTCGNGILESGEECDDGNNVDGDGCSVACRNEGEVRVVPVVVDGNIVTAESGALETGMVVITFDDDTGSPLSFRVTSVSGGGTTGTVEPPSSGSVNGNAVDGAQFERRYCMQNSKGARLVALKSPFNPEDIDVIINQNNKCVGNTPFIWICLYNLIPNPPVTDKNPPQECPALTRCQDRTMPPSCEDTCGDGVCEILLGETRVNCPQDCECDWETKEQDCPLGDYSPGCVDITCNSGKCDYRKSQYNNFLCRTGTTDNPAYDGRCNEGYCEPGVECGNGVIDSGEECDRGGPNNIPENIGGKTCNDFTDENGVQYTGGELHCKYDCTYDTSGCTGGDLCVGVVCDNCQWCDSTTGGCTGGCTGSYVCVDGACQPPCTGTCALDNSNCGTYVCGIYCGDCSTSCLAIGCPNWEEPYCNPFTGKCTSDIVVASAYGWLCPICGWFA